MLLTRSHRVATARPPNSVTRARVDDSNPPPALGAGAMTTVYAPAIRCAAAPTLTTGADAVVDPIRR
ncbi:hypothetical protein PJI17_32830, partial [Mycobacterium kansasii]